MSLNRDVAPTTLGSLMRRTSAERGMTSAVSRAPAVVGNASSMIYHWPGCPGYAKTSARNRVEFGRRGTAESDGYRPARNCCPGKSRRHQDVRTRADEAKRTGRGMRETLVNLAIFTLTRILSLPVSADLSVGPYAPQRGVSPGLGHQP